MESLVEEKLYPEEIGRYVVDFCKNPENYPMLDPMVDIYYDKKNKGYLILDSYKILDTEDNLEKVLDKFAFEHPERFEIQMLVEY